MIDWLTLKLCTSAVPDQGALADYLRDQPHLVRYLPRTGEVEWTVTTRDSSRSDSHGVTVHVGKDVEISGSPARSMGGENNVFGSGDIAECARAHIAAANAIFAAAESPFQLPTDLTLYRVSRVDVTENYYLGSLDTVKQALAFLRQSDGGRYKVQAKAETVYWSPGSRRRKGKAYAKGPHLAYQIQQGRAVADLRQQQAANGLLRLELTLGSQWWSEQKKPFWQITEAEFSAEHNAYFSGLIGTGEVKEMADIATALEKVAPSKGQAEAAHRTWCVIQSVGHQNARASMPRATWFRHLALLQAAGLAWGDICAGKVSEIRLARTRVIVLDEPVKNWKQCA